MTILTKRVYDEASSSDGTRILVDRLWPRGVSKDRAQVGYWAKEIAPSGELRKWYGHDSDKWEDFKAKYFKELDANPAGLDALRSHLKARVVTLVFGSKEETLNNASALKIYLEERGLVK